MNLKFFMVSEHHSAINRAHSSRDVVDNRTKNLTKSNKSKNDNKYEKLSHELTGDLQVIKHTKYDKMKQDMEQQLSSKAAKILGLKPSDLCEEIFNQKNEVKDKQHLTVADVIMKFESFSQSQPNVCQKGNVFKRQNTILEHPTSYEDTDVTVQRDDELSPQRLSNFFLSKKYSSFPPYRTSLNRRLYRSKSDIFSNSYTVHRMKLKEMRYLKSIFKNRSSMIELADDDRRKSKIVISRYKAIMGDLHNRRLKQKIAKRMVEFRALSDSRFYTENGQPAGRVRSFTYEPMSTHLVIPRTLSNPDVLPKEEVDLSANNETYIPYTAVGSSEDIHLLTDEDNRQSVKAILHSLEQKNSLTNSEIPEKNEKRPQPKPRPKPTGRSENPERQIPKPKPRQNEETKLKNDVKLNTNQHKTSITPPILKPKPSSNVLKIEKKNSLSSVKDDENVTTPTQTEKSESPQDESKTYDKPTITNALKEIISPISVKQNSTKVFNFNDVLPYAIVKLDTENGNKTEEESPDVPLKQSSPSLLSLPVTHSEEFYLEPVDSLENSPIKSAPSSPGASLSPSASNGKIKYKRSKFKDKTSTMSKSYAEIKHKVSIKEELHRRKSLPNYLVPNEVKESEETDIYESVSPYNSDDDVGWDADEFESSEEEEFIEIPKMPQLEGVTKKIYHIVTEILTTERAYVKRLNLLENIFHQTIMKEATENNMIPLKVVNEIFPNLSPIYTFHSTILLPELEKRIQEWNEIQKIGDIFKTLGHCLLLYTEFVKNFDHATSSLTHWLKKSPKFLSVVEELQRRRECENLTLHHHMLEPIQRVPRYKLLLTDYLKKLPADSPDREESQASLVIISKAAENANNSMKENEKFKQLLDLEDRIQEGLNGESLVTASRVFIKEGELVKLAARKGSKMTRTILLFNDCLLCCLVTTTGKLRVRQIMDMTGLTIDVDDPSLPDNSFRIKSTQRILDLIAKNEEEKETWISSIRDAVTDLHEKRGTTIERMLAEDENNKYLNVGQNAPLWVKDEDVTMCMLCALKFGLVHRKHHCRGCGRVVCDKCSSHRAKLAYAGNTIQRVCYACVKKLGHKVEDQEEKLSKSVLTRDSSAFSDMSGEMYWKAPGKSWSKEWIVLSEFVLYIQKKKQDVKAHTQIPVPGYDVCDPSSADEIDSTHPYCLKIHKENKKDLTYFMSSENEEAVRSWKKHLELAVNLEKITEKKECEQNV